MTSSSAGRDRLVAVFQAPTSYGSGETHRELSARAGAAIRDLLEQSRDGTVIGASHGNWIARALEAVGAPATLAVWRAMPNPAVYEISGGAASITVVGPGLPA